MEWFSFESLCIPFRQHGVVNPAKRSPWLTLIGDTASCKPISVAPHPPHSLHSPQSDNITSSTSGHSTPSTLWGTNIRSIYSHSKERPPIGCYFPRSCLSPHKNEPSVFRPNISCFTLFHHVAHGEQLTTFLQLRISFSARLLPADSRCGANGCRSVRLGVCRALPVSRYACARCCTSAHLGGGPSSTTNERRLSPMF